MKYLKAYSVIELLVVMLISSLVMSFCYVALEFTSTQHRDFEQKQAQIYHVNDLLDQINRNCLNADKIIQHKTEILFIKDNNTTRLSFGDSTILTINDSPFVYPINTKKLTAFFRQEEQLINNGTVDYFEFELLLNGNYFPCSYFKTYDASTLLKIDYERNQY